MKKRTITLALFCTMNMMIMTQAQNPFLQKYDAPHGAAPFNKIKVEHYEPALLEGMKQQMAEVKAIIDNKQAPTFKNTILALEKSGALLSRVGNIFYNILGAEKTDELQAVAEKMMPVLTEHGNNIGLNDKLFQRVKAVYSQKSKLKLTAEESKLLQNTYDGFVRQGANLTGSAKDKYRALSTELSKLDLKYDENNLKETNNYEMVITDKSKLAGLPESALEAAAFTAKNKGKEGWLFTLNTPSYLPFMTYCENRDLRKEIYFAYNTRCAKNNDLNNFAVLSRIAAIHMEIAQLLGYKDYASFVLEKRMAKNSESVHKLLNQLLDAYKPTAEKELKEVQELACKIEGADFKFMPWDWGFYSNKLKLQKFNISSEMLRPYFELSKVKEGVFGLATKLYGITFKKNADIPVYQKDVDAYEVFDKDGKFLAILYTDFHPRAGKRAGAWMTNFKEQWKENGVDSRPHVSLVMNFTEPTDSKPALLTYDEVETFLHEFGHSLHGMFANTTFASISGTNVYRDFVELPSQFMENFGTEKEFLNTFAKHYQTGEVIPQELIQKMIDSSNFNIGNSCLRQLSLGLIDMAWYTRTTPFNGDVIAYERQATEKTQLLPFIDGTCMSTQFGHIFSGGYSAGYYSYKWAEVLDADAFSLFKQKGIFNKEVADSFRKNVLSQGGTQHPMNLYKNFRGQEPTIDALLIRNGLK